MSINRGRGLWRPTAVVTETIAGVRNRRRHSLVCDRSKVNVCMWTRCQRLPTDGSWTSGMAAREKEKGCGNLKGHKNLHSHPVSLVPGLKARRWPGSQK